MKVAESKGMYQESGALEGGVTGAVTGAGDGAGGMGNFGGGWRSADDGGRERNLLGDSSRSLGGSSSLDSYHTPRETPWDSQSLAFPTADSYRAPQGSAVNRASDSGDTTTGSGGVVAPRAESNQSSRSLRAEDLVSSSSGGRYSRGEEGTSRRREGAMWNPTADNTGIVISSGGGDYG
ncbi:unnamed protein product, partial [Discosporangium mesarthrocarpum]